MSTSRSGTAVPRAASLCVATGVAAACMLLVLPAHAQTGKPAAVLGGSVRLPDPHVPGYRYPESQDTILKHVNEGDDKWITRHAWGLWTALTTPVLPGVLVYETWDSPDSGSIISPGKLGGGAAQIRHRLQRPRQFHGRAFAKEAAATANAAALPSTSNQVLVTVNWSPEMVDDVKKNDLLSSAQLQKLLTGGTAAIALNNLSITLKPTYLWLGAPLLAGGRYYQLSTWPGPNENPGGFPSNLWGQCVWVDTRDNGKGSGTGATDGTCSADGGSRTPATTYGLANFIHFKLTKTEAEDWKTEGINVTVNGKAYQPTAGESVILAAMHVGTREMTEWTWQTFWWQPDADNPPAPSSKTIAEARPAQLRGAARHYAQCAAYQMVTPNQPVTGGSGTEPWLCYSPYLEAPFTNQVTPAHPQPDLPASAPWTYKGTTYNLNLGVQTNCMSCHLQAAYPQNPSAPQYTADQYIDLNSPEFKGFLQMDFAWSIVDNVK